MLWSSRESARSHFLGTLSSPQVLALHPQSSWARSRVPQCSVSDSLSLIPTLPLNVSLLTYLPHNSFCVNSKLGKLRQTQSSVIFTNNLTYDIILAPTCFDLPLSQIASQSPLLKILLFTRQRPSCRATSGNVLSISTLSVGLPPCLRLGRKLA